jgi:hypothetical protein
LASLEGGFRADNGPEDRSGFITSVAAKRAAYFDLAFPLPRETVKGLSYAGELT